MIHGKGLTPRVIFGPQAEFQIAPDAVEKQPCILYLFQISQILNTQVELQRMFIHLLLRVQVVLYSKRIERSS